MYTEFDLAQAEAEGVLPHGSVNRLRDWSESRNHTRVADEENLRFVSSFNDVFVFLAITLVLIALGISGATLTGWDGFGFGLCAVCSWFFAEYFTRIRRMSLPSIQLLITFVSCLGLTIWQPGLSLDFGAVVAASAMVIGALFHWWRFRVPITVAMGALAGVSLVLSLPFALMPSQVSFLMDLLPWMMLVCGVSILILALYWDQKDLLRLNWQSDVAFWCHLAAAPLIVHALFHLPGLSFNLPLTLTVYIVLAGVALLIDRRSLLVSGLVYVISSINQWAQFWQGENFIWLGLLVLGVLLLCLSVFWQKLRLLIVSRLSYSIQSRVPSIR